MIVIGFFGTLLVVYLKLRGWAWVGKGKSYVERLFPCCHLVIWKEMKNDVLKFFTNTRRHQSIRWNFLLQLGMKLLFPIPSGFKLCPIRIPPSPEVLKLNFKGSVTGNSGQAEIGRIIQIVQLLALFVFQVLQVNSISMRQKCFLWGWALRKNFVWLTQHHRRRWV